jgi:micrococcal nuclease
MRPRSRNILAGAPLVLLTALAVLGCAREAEVTESTPPTKATPSPYVRPGLTPARVTRVVDGDTIRVEIGGEEFRVRYIGIDTPETVDPRRPVQCLGQQASERNRQLVEDKVVGLEKDVSDTDSFGRLLRYVWVGDRMTNAALVEEGFALASTYPPDVRYVDRFASLQTQARENGRGLWGEVCAAGTPSPAH